MTYKALVLYSAAIGLVAATPAFAESRTYDLAGFDSISVATGISANISVGGDYAIRAESSQKELERLEITVDGDELKIRRESRFGLTFGRRDQIRVSVTLPALDELDVSSGASAKASGVDSDDFSAEASSGGSATIAGVCGDLEADVSSGGSVDAEDLECETADAEASSGGSARIYASQSVTADASSGGSITVSGGPKNTDIDKSSGGSVTIRE